MILNTLGYSTDLKWENFCIVAGVFVGFLVLLIAFAFVFYLATGTPPVSGSVSLEISFFALPILAYASIFIYRKLGKSADANFCRASSVSLFLLAIILVIITIFLLKDLPSLLPTIGEVILSVVLFYLWSLFFIQKNSHLATDTGTLLIAFVIASILIANLCEYVSAYYAGSYFVLTGISTDQIIQNLLLGFPILYFAKARKLDSLSYLFALVFLLSSLLGFLSSFYFVALGTPVSNAILLLQSALQLVALYALSNETKNNEGIIPSFS